MGQRGAVKAAPGLYAELLFQAEGGLGIVQPRKIHRYHTHLAFGVQHPQHPQSVLLHLPHPGDEMAGQPLLPPAQVLPPLGGAPVQCGPEPVNPGKIQRARLKPVRKEAGHTLQVRKAPRPPRNERCEPLCQGVGEE